MRKLIFILFVFLTGCVSQEEIEQSKIIREQRKIAIDACVSQGGVPIYARWDLVSLVDCKFKCKE